MVKITADLRNGAPKGFTPSEIVGLARGGRELLGQLQAAVGSGRFILAKEHMGKAGCNDGLYVNSIMANDELCSVYNSLQPHLYNATGLWSTRRRAWRSWSACSSRSSVGS